MKIINLEDFFIQNNYDWKEKNEEIFEISRLSKTRASDNTEITHHYGLEQPFLLHAISKIYNVKNFFEIGTGRGTGSYSVSLVDSVEKIITFDIVEFEQKRETAINFKKEYASNEDIYNLVPYKEKNKIDFRNIHKSPLEKEKYKNYFDLSFIDGNHTDFDMIMDDFKLSEFVTKDDGILLFDDYGPDWAVTHVVDYLRENRDDLSFTLIPFRGHLFNKEKKEVNMGAVLVKKK